MKLFVFFALLGLAAAAPGQRTVLDTLTELGQTTIVELIELAGLTDALNGEGPFTAFVPKQEVFDNLPQEIIDEITGDLELLAKGLTYHVAPGTFLSTDAVNEALIPSLQGAELRINIYEVDGETVATVTGVPIDLTQVDIEASNGIIHFLDFIILDVPDYNTVDTLLNFPADSGYTFEALAFAAGSVDAVSDALAGTDYTLLAPVDSEGFTVAVVEELLGDLDYITSVLLDHAASGTVYSVGIGARKEFTTVGGNTIVIEFTEDQGFIVTDTAGNFLADVIAGDIPTTQGVVHLLDRPIILA
ncbi:unnamed protein product [Notodromas monacha]|uniref:FAS1 domain-containing protein n=1 Tax=Notodromas monacha TaxID=399045 RepID=A0A7R9GIU0_9CRUS|nr:unnamed protein product [Notodromas monacha]CAG0922957.1 unnamed protein product [Notodromas monacha]